MTLENLLLQSLDKWRPASRASHTVDHPESGWRVTLDAGLVDAIGVQLHTLRVARLHPLETTPPLRERAEAIARRVSGLLEPLRLLEVDEGRGVAQLRSDAPALRGEARRYYELLRHDSGASELARYESTSGPRQAVPFTLTHEALGKLVRDLAA